MDVLFEDNHCLAIAKPAGLATQAPAGVPSAEALAKDYLRERTGKAGNVYLGVPHRLDRPVSGVVLFARTSKAAARLAEQFRERQVTKVYWGWLDGTLAEEAGVWRDWIRKIPDTARAEACAPDADGAREAVTAFRRLVVADGRTLVELTPETGRMHQLRLQASLHCGPIVGDALYGSASPFGPERPAGEGERDRAIALHAKALTFLHPIRYEAVTVAAPLPAYWPGESGATGHSSSGPSCSLS